MNAIHTESIARPPLVEGEDPRQSVWAIIVDGKTRLTREAPNGDMAWASYAHFLAEYPRSRVALMFSHGDRHGREILCTLVARSCVSRLSRAA